MNLGVHWLVGEKKPPSRGDVLRHQIVTKMAESRAELVKLSWPELGTMARTTDIDKASQLYGGGVELTARGLPEKLPVSVGILSLSQDSTPRRAAVLCNLRLPAKTS